MKHATLIAGVLALLPLPAPGQSRPAFDQTSRRGMVAVPLNPGATITLDGRFEEEVWSRAVPAADFVQQDPDNGKPSTERTEVRIAFDDHKLYMAVNCFDSDPSQIIAYHRRRDENITADDKFAWIFDTYLDGRSAYYFDMTPGGLMGDAVVGNGGMTGTRDWNGIWDARARRTETGWALEIEIPFQTLSFNPNSDTWGINFSRTIRRKNEETLWSGWGRNQRLLNPSFAGRLTGIHAQRRGLGLDVKPYGVATSEGAGPAGGRSDNSASAGVDLFYNPSPGLRATLTVNTDFAQTEVDQRQVNLTRFSLFFPEKRDFFLDGSMFFDFGSVTLGGKDNAIVPFFSRRIGLDANGQPQKIDVGAKLAGQVGHEDIGLLQVRTGEDKGIPGEDLTVVRLRHRFLRASYIGALYTRRDVRNAAAPDAQTAGVDFLTQTLIGPKILNVGAFYVNTTTAAETRDSAAYGVAVDYPNDFVTGAFVLREVQDNYSPALGFTLRTGFRRVNPSLSINPRPRNSRLVRRLSFGVDSNLYLDNRGNQLLNRDWDVTLTGVDFHSQDHVDAHFLRSFERLQRNFPISPGITLPAGRTYSASRFRLQASTAQRRRVMVSQTTELGSFYSGSRKKFAMDMTFRARTGVSFAVAGEWNQVALAEGRFQTRLYRFITETQPSPRISIVNNVQFDSVSGVLGWQSRFRWILTPGNDLHVVYLHNWLDDPVVDRFTSLGRRASSKVIYTHRF